MRATWYVLEDGNVADPSECTADEKGRLTHKGGVAVAMRGEVPHSRGVDLEEGGAAVGAKSPAKSKQAEKSDDRQVKASGKEKDPNYKTR